jgi:5-hydroxyisourate hydrolase-like protein (transthyretin family)
MTTLSTHVLNIATGTPAAGLEITLKRIEPHPKDLGVFTTNAEGRVSDKLLSDQDALLGVYEITPRISFSRYDSNSIRHRRERTLSCPLIIESLRIFNLSW